MALAKIVLTQENLLSSGEIIVLAISGIALILFVSEALAPDLIALMVLCSLGVTGILDLPTLLSGFSSPVIVTLIGLFIKSGPTVQVKSAIGAIAQIPFLVALALLGGLALMPLAMAVAFFHFFTQPPGNQLVAQLTPPRLRGLGYGIYFLVAFGTGIRVCARLAHTTPSQNVSSIP